MGVRKSDWQAIPERACKPWGAGWHIVARPRDGQRWWDGKGSKHTLWYQEDEDKQIDAQEAREEGRSSTVIHVGDATAGKPPKRR